MNKFLASIVFVAVIGIALGGGPSGTAPDDIDTTRAPPSKPECPPNAAKKCEQKGGVYNSDTCKCDGAKCTPDAKERNDCKKGGKNYNDDWCYCEEDPKEGHCPNCNMGQAGKLTWQEWKDLNVIQTRANAPEDGLCTGNRQKRIFNGKTYDPPQPNMCCCEPENSPWFAFIDDLESDA